MTVYRSADHADVFACYKQQPVITPLPELSPALEAKIAATRKEAEAFEGQPLIVKDMFRLVDDLQRICKDGCVLDTASIGSIQAKLIMLRINLNVHHGVNTAQLH
jgi:hypothetical protein